MKNKKKYSIKLIGIISIIIIILSTIISNVWGDDIKYISIDGHGNFYYLNELGEYLKISDQNKEVFINTGVENIISGSIGIQAPTEYLPLEYSTTECVNAYKGDSRGWTIIRDIVDFYINNDGELYVRITDETKGVFETKASENDAKLAAAIYYAQQADDGWIDDDNDNEKNHRAYERYIIGYYYQNFLNSYSSYLYSALGCSMHEDLVGEGLTRIGAKVDNLGKELYNYKKIKVIGKDATAQGQGNGTVILGPFNVTWGGKNVESININGIENVNQNEIEWSKDKNTWKSIKEGEGVPSGTNFYLRVRGTLKEENKIEVTFTQGALEVNKARMLLTGMFGGSSDSSQDIAIYSAIEGSPKTDTCVIEKEETPPPQSEQGKIVVNKTDSTTRTGLNIKFIVQTKDKNGNEAWLGQTTLGFKYNSDRARSKAFSTPGGTYTIEGLSTNYTYKVYEIELPTGYSWENQDYRTTINGTNAVNLNYYISGNSSGNWVDLKNASNNTITINAINKKSTTPPTPTTTDKEILIMKKDQYTGQSLDFSFKIWTSTGWVKADLGKANSSERELISRTKTCPNCNGNKEVACTKCNGLGYRTGSRWITCNTCGGSGIDGGNKCGGCNGTGGRYNTYPCPDCHGSKKINCPECGGTGKVDNSYYIYYHDPDGSETYDFNGTFEQATVFSSTNGYTELNILTNPANYSSYRFRNNETIENNTLPTSKTYTIWETRNNTDAGWYPIEVQSGYQRASNPNPNNRYAVNLGSVSSNGTLTATNVRRNLTVSGYVWQDISQKGEQVLEGDSSYEEGNSLLDGNPYNRNTTRDKKLSGITVRLYRKGRNQPTATTTTDSNGYYKFENTAGYSRISDYVSSYKGISNYYTPDDYYVEFDYSSKQSQNIKYIPVAFNKNNAENASRAMMQEVAYSDAELNGIAKTYSGNDYSILSTYGFSAFVGNFSNSTLYDSANYEIKNINLGIKKIYDPTYELSEDLQYVKIILNGNQFVYKYGSKGLVNASGAPMVSFQGYSGSYQRPVYPSDIYYLQQNGDNDPNTIKAYAVYAINIKNTTVLDVKDLYREQNLVIKSLNNTFDTNKFELEMSQAGEDTPGFTLESRAKDDFNKWEISGEGTAKYKGGNIILGVNQAAVKYIQFKVQPDEIKRILTNSSDNSYQGITTKANATGYHNFTRNDYSWNNYARYNGPHEDGHESSDDSKSDTAPYLKFTLPGNSNKNNRTITGNVFVDNVITTNGEVLGNGEYNSGENVLNNVKVELLTSSKDVAKIYFASDSPNIDRYSSRTMYEDLTEDTYYQADAVTYTDTSGNYIFDGVEPGEYYIRFTYEDGKTEIFDSYGNNVEDVLVDDYKSTKIPDGAAKVALKASLGNNEAKTALEELLREDSASDGEWYKYQVDNLSVAVDDLDLRATFNTKSIDDEIWRDKAMTATTPLVYITQENSTSDYLGGETYTGEFKGFNFGIVRQPQQKLEAHKIITGVQISNNGTNIIPLVNPKNANVQGVADLDGNTNGGSLYTRLEIEPEKIYGATLTLEYTITVRNVSETNYYETKADYQGWYYMFGEHGNTYGSREVEINVEEILDLYDKVMKVTLPENDNGYYYNPNIENQTKAYEGKVEELLIKKVSSGIQTNGVQITDKNNNLTGKDSINGEFERASELKTVINTKRYESINAQLEKLNNARREEKNITDYEKVVSLTDPENYNGMKKSIIKINGEPLTRKVIVTKLITPDENLDFYNIAGISQAKVSISKDISDVAERKNAEENSLRYVRPIIETVPYLNYDGTTRTTEIVEATLIPPTGSDTQYIILISTISGIIILSIIAVGIVIIKKKN